jgi:hypothetical protein
MDSLIPTELERQQKKAETLNYEYNWFFESFFIFKTVLDLYFEV